MMTRKKLTLVVLLAFLTVLVGLSTWKMWRLGRQEALNRALIQATKQNKTENALAALEAGANANATEHALPSFWSLFSTLFRNGAPSRSAVGPTALIYAAEHDNVVEIQALLAKGADVNAKAVGSWNAFRLVALKADVPTMRVLLQAGADIDGVDAQGETTLMNAALLGRRKAVEALLDVGAKVNIADTQGETALSNAADWDEITELLLAHGAAVNTVDAYGLTPLMQCVSHSAGSTTLSRQFYKRHVRIMRLLLAQGAEVNLKSKKGKTALMGAAYWGNVEMVNALLKAHADVNIRDAQGKTARSRAMRYGHTAVVQLLDKAGATKEP